MDKATIGGILGSIAMVLFGILIGSGLGPFVTPPSMLIVVGGTLVRHHTACATGSIGHLGPGTRRGRGIHRRCHSVHGVPYESA